MNPVILLPCVHLSGNWCVSKTLNPICSVFYMVSGLVYSSCVIYFQEPTCQWYCISIRKLLQRHQCFFTGWDSSNILQGMLNKVLNSSAQGQNAMMGIGITSDAKYKTRKEILWHVAHGNIVVDAEKLYFFSSGSACEDLEELSSIVSANIVDICENNTELRKVDAFLYTFAIYF